MNRTPKYIESFAQRVLTARKGSAVVRRRFNANPRMTPEDAAQAKTNVLAWVKQMLLDGYAVEGYRYRSSTREEFEQTHKSWVTEPTHVFVLFEDGSIKTALKPTASEKPAKRTKPAKQASKTAAQPAKQAAPAKRKSVTPVAAAPEPKAQVTIKADEPSVRQEMDAITARLDRLEKAVADLATANTAIASALEATNSAIAELAAKKATSRKKKTETPKETK